MVTDFVVDTYPGLQKGSYDRSTFIKMTSKIYMLTLMQQQRRAYMEVVTSFSGDTTSTLTSDQSTGKNT